MRRGQAARAAAFESREPHPAPNAEKTKPAVPHPGEVYGRVLLREVSREEGRETRRLEVAAELARKEQKAGDRWVEKSGPNEDQAFVNEKYGFFGVADGMGGYAQGEKASARVESVFGQVIPLTLERVFELTPKVVKEYSRTGEMIDPRLARLRDFVESELGIKAYRFASAEDVEQAILGSLLLANDKIKKEAPDAGTTISAAVTYETVNGELRAKIVNRGNSRIYRFRGGKLEQLTKDDSLVQLLLEQGLIDNDEDLEQSLSRKALNLLEKSGADRYESGTILKDIRNVVTAGLGADDERDVARTKFIDTDLKRGDIVIAVTDGVIDNFTREQVQAILEQHKTAHTMIVADAIVKDAQKVARSNNPRAKLDDIGVAVASVENVGQSIARSLEEHWTKFKDTYGVPDSEIEDQDQFAKALEQALITTTILRNQLDLARESYSTNEKLQTLHDHVMRLLGLLDDRQRALYRGEEFQKDEDDESLDFGTNQSSQVA